jgi:hypothetical protein
MPSIWCFRGTFIEVGWPSYIDKCSVKDFQLPEKYKQNFEEFRVKALRRELTSRRVLHVILSTYTIDILYMTYTGTDRLGKSLL